MSLPIDSLPTWSDADILAQRPAKNAVEANRPYAYFVEEERTARGTLERVATVFLTNRECPFRCLMCDLWKNTTDETVPAGAIPEQIEFALGELPPADHIKLYNSGNFFDRQAIPASDYQAIAKLVAPFRSVIVENHPRLCGSECVRFRDLVGKPVEVAIGLETIHPDILPRLNKRMSLADFDAAVRFLVEEEFAVRAFILSQLPYVTEDVGVHWAMASIGHAFALGISCCAVISTRIGNGAMDAIHADGQLVLPTIDGLEAVAEAGIRMDRGRVFADLWDIEALFRCAECGPARADRLHEMNRSQCVPATIECRCREPGP